ncbi:hypothetical protein QFZ36_000499 [Pseudarthrobacter siccitolerans]|uniref:Uncharacterized protein n=1 Tax=Pseudarthrobacter siccitolerans TaxID=861266 RepID=A0ABU0PG60_9MICC|nr:hypothetical protein [Pseudarthrobacter siccitolerans]MDQ0672938.1 hypothetical protein [Pseudarthrobacter siccitolerans]
MAQRKLQRNGLLQPFTVMLENRPYPTEAKTIEEAIEQAKKKRAAELGIINKGEQVNE